MIGIKKVIINRNSKPGDKVVHSCCYFRLGDKIVSEAVIRYYQSCAPANWNIVVQMEECINSLSMADVVKCDELWTISFDPKRLRRTDFLEHYRKEMREAGVKQVYVYHSGFFAEDKVLDLKRQCVFLEAEKLKKKNVFPNFNVHNGYTDWAYNHADFKKLQKKHKFCFHFRNSNSASLRNLDF